MAVDVTTPTVSAGAGSQPAPAAVALPEICTELLVGLYAYLRDHAVTYPVLAAAIPFVRAGVASYRAGALDAAVDACRQAFTVIQQARVSVPALPPP